MLPQAVKPGFDGVFFDGDLLEEAVSLVSLIMLAASDRVERDRVERREDEVGSSATPRSEEGAESLKPALRS